MEVKYNKVIKWLSDKVPEKQVNWENIFRITQEAKESVHAFYERFMQVYSKYSGNKDPERENVCAFVTTFVRGLRKEMKDHFRQT